MGRYTNTKIISTTRGRKGNKNGITKLSTTIYRKIPERNDDIYVMSTVGDRFDLLANQYYGDPHLWWYIAKANNMKFNNIEPGTVLRIPTSTEFAKGT
jgi:nucleoid-associated protein YgaU